MKIRSYNPAEGQAFQGDVAIVPVPEGISIATHDEIQPVDGRLILQEGEVTGHHHAVHLDGGKREKHFRPADQMIADPMAGMSPELRQRMAGKSRAAKAVAARMYRDPIAANAMVNAGILERTDLCVGFLVVGDAGAVVRHEEHDAIRLPGGSGGLIQPNLDVWPGGYVSQAGVYLIGRQVESVGAEERRVAD